MKNKQLANTEEKGKGVSNGKCDKRKVSRNLSSYLVAAWPIRVFRPAAAEVV